MVEKADFDASTHHGFLTGYDSPVSKRLHPSEGAKNE